MRSMNPTEVWVKPEDEPLVDVLRADSRLLSTARASRFDFRASEDQRFLSVYVRDYEDCWHLARKLIARFEDDHRMLDLMHRLETWKEDDYLGLKLVFVGVEAFERSTTGPDCVEQR